jgi:exonuclease SbcC
LIPKKLTLAGFLSYRESVAVDFSQVNVACVSGANGSGKSTLFDAITWALFGKARRSDDALIHNGMDSCQVVFEFSYEKAQYRIERTKNRAKSTTLEFQVQKDDGGWKPLTEAGIRATEERIRDVLRLDYETFINASFFLQGKADMFTMQPAGKRKEILSSILGLEVWERYRVETARRRREVEQQVNIQQSILEEVIAELGLEDKRQTDLKNLEEILLKTTALRESKMQLVEQVRGQTRQIEMDNEKEKLLEEQAESLQSRFENMGALLCERKDSLATYENLIHEADQITKHYQRWNKLRGALSGLEAAAVQYNQLALRKSEVNGEIQAEYARLEQERLSLEQQQKEISAAREEKIEIENSLAEKNSWIEDLQSKFEVLESSEVQLGELKEKLADRKGENSQLFDMMKEYQERIDHLKNVHGADCPLCGQQLNEQDKEKTLVKLEAEGKELGDRYRINKDDIEKYKNSIDDLQREIDSLKKLRTQLTVQEREASGLEQKLIANKNAVDQWEKDAAPRLKTVAEILKSGEAAAARKKELLAIEKQITALKYNPKSHDKLREEELALRDIENKYRELEQARTAKNSLEREIAEFEKQSLQLKKDLDAVESERDNLQKRIKKLQKALPDIAELEKDLDAIQREENTCRQEVGAAKQLVNVLDDQRRRKTEITNKINEYNRHTANLKVLEVAFGKDGVPALLIEQSLPQIEAQANDILDRLSNGDMSVNIETQRAYADKKREDKRETLDIIIRDSAGTREYELFSGGEAFRINFAIRLALSRVLAQRSGARLQTLVIDEGFGSQDADGRQRLVEAINLISPDFEKILVITHLEELKDAFPSRIEVSKSLSGSSVEVIP